MRAKMAVQAAEQEFFDRLWYHRALYGNRTAADLSAAEANLTRVEATYPGIRADLSGYEVGLIEGKLSALRWVLGDEWDVLDT